jgi:hypothetical protein
MSTETDRDENSSEPTTFGQRHGVTIMTVVLAALFILVCTIQVAC